jgi:hypothetical protein
MLIAGRGITKNRRKESHVKHDHTGRRPGEGVKLYSLFNRHLVCRMAAGPAQQHRLTAPFNSTV